MEDSMRDSFKITEIFREAASSIAVAINSQTRKNNIRVKFYEFFPNGNMVFRVYYGLYLFRIMLIPIVYLNDPKKLEEEINKNITNFSKFQWKK